jgi:hypothetical protein
MPGYSKRAGSAKQALVTGPAIVPPISIRGHQETLGVWHTKRSRCVAHKVKPGTRRHLGDAWALRRRQRNLSTCLRRR